MSLLDDTGVSAEALALQRVRDGDVAAYGVLYERHIGPARRLARSLLAHASDADDVVSEVFAATFAAMRNGRGPCDAFRPYVLAAVRHECLRAWRHGARQRPGGDTVVDLATAQAGERDDIESSIEGAVVRRVFASLPDRMREVLWATEIEGHSHADIATRTGSTSGAVAQLAMRARRLFGERYLDAHLPGPDTATAVGPACTATRRVLAEVVRGTASARQRRLADEHSAGCPECAAATGHLKVVNHRLRTGHVLGLLPAVTAARPVRLGLLARLFGWFAGAAPVITASTALALVVVVAPEVHDRAAAINAPAAQLPVSPREMVGLVPTQDVDGAVPRSAPDTSGGAPPNASEAAAATGATTAPAIESTLPAATSAAPATEATLPTADTTAPPTEAALPKATDALPAAPSMPETATTPPPSVVAGAGAIVEQTVNGLTLDDGVVGAVQPVLDALPPVRVDVQLPATPLVGPVGPVGPVSVGAATGGGSVGVAVGVGPAQLSAAVGGTGGVRVELPNTATVVAALPTPVPAVIGPLPVVGQLLGG